MSSVAVIVRAISLNPNTTTDFTAYEDTNLSK